METRATPVPRPSSSPATPRHRKGGPRSVGRASRLSLTSKPDNGDRRDACPTLIVLVRNLAQLEAALKCGVTTIYCEFEDPKKYREAVTTFHTVRGCCDSASRITHHASSPGIFVAPPRIFKMGDDWILSQVRSCNADGYLVRN